ncbi:MAG: hypothetical protein LBF08_02085 [Dysgonamonadaceae bacterium]|nr:hypothetical protein [Dysgonamonadaceae bacterium]
MKISLPVSALRIFTGLFTGIFISVLCYSIVRTSGNTSSLLFIPLIGFYFFFVKRKQPVQPVNVTAGSKKTIYALLGYTLLVSSLLFLLFCYANLDGSYRFRPVEGDDYSYGILSQYLSRGFENLAFSKNFWVDGSHYSYHYFEIWLNALLYKIFHLNATWTFSLILPTILHTVIFWGLMSIVNGIKKINLPVSGLCFILLFTTEISIILSRFGTSFFPYPNQYCSGLILTKVAPVGLFFLAVILLLIHRKNKEALLVALSMPIVSFVMTPVVFAVVGYLILKDLIRNKGAIKYEYLIPYAVTLCLFAVYILSGEQQGRQDLNLFHTNFLLVNEMKFRLFITNPIGFGMRYIFPIALILLIDFKRFLKFCRRYGMEIFLFFTVSTAFNVVLHSVIADATQFTTLAYYGVFNILFPALILYFWQNKHYVLFGKLKKIALPFVFIIGYSLNIATVISFFSNNRYLSNANRLKYEEIIVKNIQPDRIHIGVIRPGEKVSNWGNFNLASQNYIHSFLDAYKNDVIYYSIVIGTGAGISEETAFSALFKEARQNNPSLTQDDFRIDFIKRTGINYICVHRGGEVPANLSGKLRLIAKDAASEECFYKVANL